MLHFWCKRPREKTAVDNKKMQTNSGNRQLPRGGDESSVEKRVMTTFNEKWQKCHKKTKKKSFWKGCWIWTAEKSKTFYCFCSDKNTPEGLSSHNLLKVEPLCNRKHFNWNHHKLVCDALPQHPKGYAVGD